MNLVIPGSARVTSLLAPPVGDDAMGVSAGRHGMDSAIAH